MQNIHNLKKYPNVPLIGIYFLWCYDDIVYIGQSIDILKRLYDHRKNKKFTSYSYIECDVKDLLSLEEKYIKTYNPILNKTHSISNNIINNTESIIFENNTGIIKNDIFYCCINNIQYNFKLCKKNNFIYFIGFKGSLKLNSFTRKDYYGEILFNNKKYFIIFDTIINKYTLITK